MNMIPGVGEITKRGKIMTYDRLRIPPHGGRGGPGMIGGPEIRAESKFNLLFGVLG